jgi:hypothetical protein
LVAACLTAGMAMLLRDRLRTLRAALVERRLKAGLCPA